MFPLPDADRAYARADAASGPAEEPASEREREEAVVLTDGTVFILVYRPVHRGRLSRRGSPDCAVGIMACQVDGGRGRKSERQRRKSKR